MKRILISLGALLVLTECGSTNVAYKMVFSTNDPARQRDLTQAVVHVIQGRLVALGTEVGIEDIVLSDSGTVINVKGIPQDAANQLTYQLSQPLNFAIMQQAPAGEAEISAEKIGGLKSTGIMERHIDRVTVVTGANPDDNSVTMTFTPEGQALLKQVFANNQGKLVAVTVRHHLVSTVNVDKSLLGATSIQIVGAPKDISEAFTDDVNVGSHVLFAPIVDAGK